MTAYGENVSASLPLRQKSRYSSLEESLYLSVDMTAPFVSSILVIEVAQIPKT